MLQFPRWKIIAILASVVLSIIVALPNALTTVLPSDIQERLGGWNLKPMTLGLDLQGGSNVLLEIDRVDLRERLSRQLQSDVRNALRDAQVGYSGLNRSADGVRLRITKPEDVEKVRAALGQLLQPVDTGFFGSGTAATVFTMSQQDQQYSFTFSEPGLDAKIALAISQSLKIVANRVNALGTTEPVIQQQGKDRIVVQLPGVQNPDQVKSVIGRTAKLTFQLLCETQPAAAGQNPPPDCDALPSQDLEGQQQWVQSSSRATVDGADLVDARGTFGQQNDPVVSFRFNTRGAERFARLTRDNVGRQFAIVLDGEIVSAPVINEAILGGQGQISGRFSVEQTNDLAIVLRSGALPAKLDIIEERTVGPSLGSDSIRAGVIAAAIGLVGIMIFILLPYGLFGIFANLALLINLISLVAIMSFFGFTLTLPGIAGIVLTLGMAVDSNVLVYERIREEWRNGRTPFNAVETGFKEALNTVLDANITTLIAAVVLFGVGSGPVRGFAVTLAIGIFTTMFTAFTVTRLIVAIWVLRTKPKEIPL